MATFAATHLGADAYAPLAIDGALHTLDATDFARLDLAPLYSALREMLESAAC